MARVRSHIFWFPEYLTRTRGFDMAAIGRYSWIPFDLEGCAFPLREMHCTEANR